MHPEAALFFSRKPDKVKSGGYSMMKTTLKTLALISLALALCASSVTAFALSENNAVYEGSGFVTPEEAAQCYLEGLRDGDLAKMLGAFAIEAYVHGFDYEAFLLRAGGHSASMSPAYPSVNDLFLQINVESRKQEIVGKIKGQLVKFAMPDYDQTIPRGFGSGDSATNVAIFVKDFEQHLGSLSFEDLQIGDSIPPASLSAHYEDEKSQKNRADRAKILGADEIRSIVIGFTLHKEQFIFCCNAARYGERWYLENLGGDIAQFLSLSFETGGIAPYGAF